MVVFVPQSGLQVGRSGDANTDVYLVNLEGLGSSNAGTKTKTRDEN